MIITQSEFIQWPVSLKSYKFYLEVWLLFLDSKTIAALVLHLWKFY